MRVLTMQQITTVIKLKLLPDAESAKILDGQSRICNWLYNQLLTKANAYRAHYRETQDNNSAKILYTKFGLRNLVPELKRDHPFLNVVYAAPLKNTALRLTASIQTYQKTRKGKQKGKTGWPRFRSWKAGWFSLFYDEPYKGYHIKDQTLQLSLGMGQDRKHRFISINMPAAALLQDKEIHNLRIVKQGGMFFAVFTFNTQFPQSKPIKNVIALDPNHKNPVYGVNTQGHAIEIAAPFWLKKFDKRLDELRSKRDKCNKKSRVIDILNREGHPTGKKRYEPSRRWKHLNTTLEKVDAKRREQTKIFCYTAASQLFREHDLVAIGDYTPHGNGCTTQMRRAMNNRSLIGRFKEILSWVAQKSGKSYEEYKEDGTTRTCSHCGYRLMEGLQPSIRIWICPACQMQHFRDENAAQNGLVRVLENRTEKNGDTLRLVPSSGHVEKRWAWCVQPRGVVIAPWRKNSDKITSTKKLNEARGSALPI